MPYCINCGKVLNDGANFCFHCGAGVPKAEPAVQALPVESAPATPSYMPVDSVTDQSPQSKKPCARNILGRCLLAACLLFCVLGAVYGVISAWPKSKVKTFTEFHVLNFWQDWDENMELVSITYVSIKEDTWDEDEIREYVNECGNWGFTDVDGNEYDTYWDYWEEIGYDPYNATYTIYTVRGEYHVTDNRKQDYTGWYCVTLLHRENMPWHSLETEIEMPDELKQYLPD